MHQAFCYNCWSEQARDTVYKSRHCRTHQCLMHYVQFKLVGHSWPGLYKPLGSMPGLAICLFQDLHFKFWTFLFLPLCLLVPQLLIGFSLSFLLLLFTCHVKTPSLVKKLSIKMSHITNGREQKDGRETVFHTISCCAVDAIMGSTLQSWMEQPILHLLFISIDVGRKVVEL